MPTWRGVVGPRAGRSSSGVCSARGADLRVTFAARAGDTVRDAPIYFGGPGTWAGPVSRPSPVRLIHRPRNAGCRTPAAAEALLCAAMSRQAAYPWSVLGAGSFIVKTVNNAMIRSISHRGDRAQLAVSARTWPVAVWKRPHHPFWRWATAGMFAPTPKRPRMTGRLPYRTLPFRSMPCFRRVAGEAGAVDDPALAAAESPVSSMRSRRVWPRSRAAILSPGPTANDA